MDDIGVAPSMPDQGLALRVSFLRDSLRKSQSITDDMVATLDTIDQRLSALHFRMQPFQILGQDMRRAQENLNLTLNTADAMLTRFDIFQQAEAKIMRGPQDDLKGFLSAVDLLRSNVSFFATTKQFNNSEEILGHFNQLLAKATSIMEEEFRRLLFFYSKPMDLSYLSQFQLRDSDIADTSPSIIPPRILSLLHDLAAQLVQARRQMLCAAIYKEARCTVLEQSIEKFGLEKLSKNDIQRMHSDALESKIDTWNGVFQIAVKFLFLEEKGICGQIFEGLDSLREQCFAEATFTSFKMVIDIAVMMIKSNLAPEKKLPKLLDMHSTISELMTEIEVIFEGKHCSAIREYVLSLSHQLADTVVNNFSAFVETIRNESHDARRNPHMDETVHPVTSYVINYLNYLLDYLPTLQQISQQIGGETDTTTQPGTLIIKLIQAVLTNLEERYKNYKDPALAHIFLMNNIHYIVTHVRGSDAKLFLEDDWIGRHRRLVQQHASNYVKVAWLKVLQTLSSEGLVSSSNNRNAGNTPGLLNSSGASKDAVKERFKSFNLQFEDLLQRQSEWTIPDSELRDNVRLLIAERLVPAYASFTKRYGNLFENCRNHERYIKYTSENLQTMIDQFFQGKR